MDDINFDCEVVKNSLKREGWVLEKGVVVDGEVDGKLDVVWFFRLLEVSG